MAASSKLVVFTGNPAYSVRKGIVDIDVAVPGLSWLVVVHSPPRNLSRLVRNQWLNFKRNGWRWIPFQCRDMWQQLLARGAPQRGHSAPGGTYTMPALRARPNVRIVQVPDIHGAESLRLVRDFAPDLGLSLAAPILRRGLFEMPRLGTINLHKGRLPGYRGMPPAFWELCNDETEVGCSVHVVDETLDTGALLAQGTVQRSSHSTLRGLQLQLDEMGAQLMLVAARDVLTGASTPRRQPPTGGKTFRKPTLAQQAVLQARLAPAGPIPARLKQGVKDVAAIAGVALHRMALRHTLQPRVTVLLYHRVSDDVRDNLTVGIEQFERQMAQLSRDCRVLDIREVLTMGQVPRSSRPLVAITFDDGYLDNYEHAVPILVRHGVPAAFFVSTGLIGSQRRFPHDVRRGNPFLPLMAWDQLRQMVQAGFVIGSHTVGHIDCAAEPEAVVRGELAQSRDDLLRELGVGEPIFGYPYGGRQHMTAERLEWVKQAGYVACLSAYGGSNVGSVDRFNVLRKGVNHQFSDRSFAWDCLGLR